MSRFVSLSANDVKVSDILLTDEKGAILGSIYIENNRFIFNPPYSNLNSDIMGKIELETKDQVSGNFKDGIKISQSSNVMSYNDATKKIKYRELGLYNLLIPILPKNGSEDESRIVSTNSIIPSINAGENKGFSLGNENAYWKSLYVNDITSSSGTIFIDNPNSDEKMMIQYNPVTLQSTVSNSKITVTAVTTSTQIPNQIDASLIPFSGFTYAGKFNPHLYTRNVSPSFDSQTLKLIHTLSYEIITIGFLPLLTPVTKTNAIFQSLAGIYYVVADLGPGVTRDVTFSKLTASTNLPSYSQSIAGGITSSFTSSNPKTIKLADNDMMVLAVSLEPGFNNEINICFEWHLMQFRVPINGVTTANIIDGAVTNNKLAINSISSLNLQPNSVATIHLQNLAVVSDKIAENAVTFTKLSPDVQAMLLKTGSESSTGTASSEAITAITNSLNSLSATVASIQNTIKNDLYSMERRMLAMDEFIKTMLVTYQINNPLGTLYNYTANLQDYIDIISMNFLGKNSNGLYLVLDKYTYNIFYGTISIINAQKQKIFKLTKNDFSPIEYMTFVSTVNIIESNYPLIVAIKDTQGANLKSITLSYPAYLELTPMG